MFQDEFRDRLDRHRKENGLSVDELLDAARLSDPDGYSREALRAMYKRARRFTYRGMAAFAKGAGIPPSSLPELRLAYAQFLLDDRIQGLESALENLNRLDPEGRLDPDLDDPTLAPIQGRKEIVEDATRLARKLERRLSAPGSSPGNDPSSG